MDEQTLNAVAERQLQQDMRRAEERAVFLGFMERDSNGRLILPMEARVTFAASPRSW